VTEARVASIRARLEAEFAPELLEITDDSHLHAGHAGAKSGKGHFTVRIIADAFRDARPIDRHRMVYDALGELMQSDIHALSVTASAPGNKSKS
jgi:stress-induced morphogen